MYWVVMKKNNIPETSEELLELVSKQLKYISEEEE